MEQDSDLVDSRVDYQRSLLRDFTQNAHIDLSEGQEKATLREITRLYGGEVFPAYSDCESLLRNLGFMCTDGQTLRPDKKLSKRIAKKIRNRLFHLGYHEDNANALAGWMCTYGRVTNAKRPVHDSAVILAADSLGIVNMKKEQPEEWNRIRQDREQQKADKRNRLAAEVQEKAQKQALEVERIRKEAEKRHIAARESLLHRSTTWPKRGNARLRAIVSLSRQEVELLCKMDAITVKEKERALMAQKTGVLITQAAELIGVRSDDVSRWDEDGRLPHTHKVYVNMHGKGIWARSWIMADIDRAGKHALDWLTRDLEQKRIRSTVRMQQLMAAIQSRTANYKPSVQMKKDALKKVEDEKAQKSHLAEQQKQLRKRYQEKLAKHEQLRKISEQQIARVQTVTTGHHWDQIFPNPQLGSRHLEAYLGPTNSGKTYQSIQALKTLKHGEHGVYLAPLRLLAMEVCEDLRSQGVAVSLVTGEERDLDPHAQVVCSTIEMLDSHQHYAVAVIDEMQSITDEQRGWAWTQALFELSADHLFLLGSPAVASLLIGFAETTGDTLTIHHTKRFTNLRVTPQPVQPKTLNKGSIFVVFSRNSVIRWGEYFRQCGRSIAQIYGAMPPEVRREEARRFRSGEADILVATDAVAMGLNLPAHTVVIGEGTKYNGRTVTDIPQPLIRQIAGRAGRYGHHDIGYAAGIDTGIHHQIRQAMCKTDNDIHFPSIFVAPTHTWVARAIDAVPDINTHDLLVAWQETLKDSEWFTCMNLSQTLEKARILDGMTGSDRLSMQERLQILTAPVDVRAGQMQLFRSMVTAILDQRCYPSPTYAVKARTEELESDYKHLSLYCWFHYHYSQIFPEIQKATSERSRCVEQLVTHIRMGLKRHCSHCGAILPAQSVYGICENCYHAQHQHVYDNYW